MKNIILIIFFFIIVPSVLFAGGEYWVEQNSGLTTPLTSVSAAGSNTGWICGFNGNVLRTSNRGALWINVSGNGIPVSCQLTNIFAVNDLTAITSGNQGNTSLVFRTTSGGASWIQVFSQLNGYIDAVWMKDAQNGFMQGDAVGNRWSLWKTTNGGASWDSAGLYLSNTFSNEYGWNNSMYLNNNSIWFGTTNFKIYYSSNYGASWIAQNSQNITIFSICMVSPSYTNGYACGPEVIKTTNGGTNWTFLTAPGTGFYGGITASQTSVYYARGDKIYFSTNSGSSWTIQHTASAGSYRHISERAVNGNDFFHCWAVRDNGGISNWQFGLSVQTISNEVPDKFSLSQNYPNPFNPSTKIRFEIPLSRGVDAEGRRGVLLVIYDILGREAAILVNEQLKPGTYEVNWDASNYPSGVYYYKLISDKYTETKKMVLLK